MSKSLQERVASIKRVQPQFEWDHYSAKLNLPLLEETETRESLLEAMELPKVKPLEVQTPDVGKLVAGMTFLNPGVLPGMPSLPSIPNTGTLWGLFQDQIPSGLLQFKELLPFLNNLTSNGFKPQFGINSALTASGLGPFRGFSTEGYLDVKKGLGLDYSIDVAPDFNVSCEIEGEAALPSLKSSIIPPITVSHQVRGWKKLHGSVETLHASSVSFPVLDGEGRAKLTVKQCAVGEDPTLSLLIGKRLNRKANGNGKFASTSFAIGTNDTEKKEYEESDNDDAIDQNTKNGAKRRKIPQLRIEVVPNRSVSRPDSPVSVDRADLESLADTEMGETVLPRASVSRFVTVNWRQQWPGNLRTSAGYQSRSNVVQVDARAKLLPAMFVSAGTAWDTAQRSMSKASARLMWKPRWGFAKHLVQLESRFSDSKGLAHAIKLQRTPHKSGGLEGSLALNFEQEFRYPAVKFDLYMPT